MTDYESALSAQELLSASLRAMYRSWGFRPYKINRFEEYDLYMRNKSFLTDERILTFTDTDGKLMALKPDVTLSVVKNAREEDYPLRICYTESVYRVPRGAIGFREISQTGVESIGDLGDWEYCEALLLAAKSLETVSPSGWRLDVSDLGILSSLLEAETLPDERREELLRLISGKNTHDLKNLCAEAGIPEETRDLLCALMDLTGPLAEAAGRAMALPLPGECLAALGTLREMGLAAEALNLNGVTLDFSVVHDTRYYNGLIFTGFAEGVPAAVLSGGRYDPVMARLGKRGSAVGFAVYLDQMDRLRPGTGPRPDCRRPAGNTLAEMALNRAGTEGCL